MTLLRGEERLRVVAQALMAPVRTPLTKYFWRNG
jgi:hypothetical protein